MVGGTGVAVGGDGVLVGGIGVDVGGIGVGATEAAAGVLIGVVPDSEASSPHVVTKTMTAQSKTKCFEPGFLILTGISHIGSLQAQRAIQTR